MLQSQGKHTEAVQEYRAVLRIEESGLGTEHPQVATNGYLPAIRLHAKKEPPEALRFIPRAAPLQTKIFGPDHPYSNDAKAERELLEAERKAI